MTMEGILVIERPGWRLGAEELIELGRARPPKGAERRPYLMGRARRPAPSRTAADAELDALAAAGGFLSDQLSFTFETLDGLLDAPLKDLARDPDLVADEAGALLGRVPTAGCLAAQAVLLGTPLARFGLSVPGFGAIEVENVLAGSARVLSAGGGARGRIEEAREEILGRAPEAVREHVTSLLEGALRSAEAAG